MRAPARDLVNALVYLVALGGIVAATTVSYGMLAGTMPAVVRTWTPPETSGTGGAADTRADARYVSWRLSPEEAQKRFETRSAVLFPPTPAYPEPKNGWASVTPRADRPAPDHARAWAILRPARAEAGNVTRPAALPTRTTNLGAANVTVIGDFQAGGR